MPAIKHAADPALYPFGSEFFMAHAHLSLFPNLVGFSARLTHLPINLVIFCWHVACIFLLLLAAWRLLCVCFVNDTARWSGVALLAGSLSVPVAGTALVIMDPYLTARSLSTPLTIFAVACYLSSQPIRAVAWLILTALIHPQMSVYGAALLGSLWLVRHFRPREEWIASPGLAYWSGLPFLFEFQPTVTGAGSPVLPGVYFRFELGLV